MGRLLYGSPPLIVELDDATVAHLELVAIAKLRRSEPFALTTSTATGGRRTVWINGASTLAFELDGPAPDVDRERVEALLEAANASVGVRLPLD